MQKYKRIIIIILDSVGCGVQPDYKKFHKQRCNTLRSVYRSNKKFHLPNLEEMGLNKILFNKEPKNSYCAGKMAAITAGNDTSAGIWEMMGVPFKKRFRSLERGLGKILLKKVEKALGTKIVGNEFINGIQALNKYYDAHLQTGGPIIYFDKDGVALIAGHVNIISPQKLKKMGKILAKTLVKNGIFRIITRPFTGKFGKFTRLKGSYVSLAKRFYPSSVIQKLNQKKINIITTRHIYSILGKPKGKIKTIDDKMDNDKLLQSITNIIEKKTGPSFMIFCLRDFDMFGHYKNHVGYGMKLMEFDHMLKNTIKKLKEDDLLMITADHGCDPTLEIRGHTREYVPIILYTKKGKEKKWLGIRSTFADLGQTICYNFSTKPIKLGKYFDFF